MPCYGVQRLTNRVPGILDAIYPPATLRGHQAARIKVAAPCTNSFQLPVSIVTILLSASY
eukprot:4018419-Pyramimonas_sp.AAC.1